jgi:hypothetical protein
VVLNAVSLSGPGAEALYATGHWQNLAMPLFLSFMSIDPVRARRNEELNHFEGRSARASRTAGAGRGSH